MSEDIAQQVRSMSSNKIQVSVFLPLYSSMQFDIIKPAFLDKNNVRVFFAGRIETNKGIFDILEIAKRLEQSKPKKFKFDVCCDGSQIDALRAKVSAQMLTDVVLIHGFCAREKICEIMS